LDEEFMWGPFRGGMRMSVKFTRRDPKRASASSESGWPEEAQPEGAEQQDDPDIRHQPFQEPVAEERDIHAGDKDDHRQDVEDGRCLPGHAAKSSRPRPAGEGAAARILLVSRKLSERRVLTFVDAPTGAYDMERPDQLKALARRCRELAAATADEDTRKSLELLAQDYEASAAQSEAESPANDELPPNAMPRPEG
jgi:hypothetical protein